MIIRKTHLAHQLEATEEAGKKQCYDAQIKQILKNKDILAWILSGSVKEFSGTSLEDIKKSIEGTPEVATVSVFPGRNRQQVIAGMNTEDSSASEGTIYYDIIFYVILPNGERTKVIIDIEAQNKYHPGYDIVTRGIFYGARMLSSQLDTEFSADNYDDLKKVYSIWICMDTPEPAANTITEYSLTPKYIYGHNSVAARYDLLSVVMICLGRNAEKGAEIHKLLSTILSSDLKVEEKENILESRYHIPMTENLKEDIVNMCNLSDWVEERGIEKGREDGIKILISTLRSMNQPDNVIIKKLIESYQLSEKEATAKYEKYADKNLTT